MYSPLKKKEKKKCLFYIYIIKLQFTAFNLKYDKI